MREYKGFKIPEFEIGEDKRCLKIESNYEDMIKLNPITHHYELKIKNNFGINIVVPILSDDSFMCIISSKSDMEIFNNQVYEECCKIIDHVLSNDSNDYRGFRIPYFIKTKDGLYKLKENPLSKLNYGTGDKNDTSAVISLDLSGNVYNGLVGRSDTIGVPFVLDEFIDKDIDDANELLMKKCKDEIDKYYSHYLIL